MYTTFTFVESKTKGLARQARDILNIEAKAEISKEDLIAQIVLDVKSKQKAERLLSYYKGQLITTGCMEERKHG